MDLIAIAYGVGAVLALVIAWCGPDRRAKAVAIYLVCSWAASNVIFLTHAPGDALEQFAYFDCLAAVAITTWALWRPAIWISLIAVALDTQLVFQLLHLVGAPMFDDAWTAILINNLLYAMQLLAVTGPTFTRLFGFKTRRMMRRKPGKPPKRAQIALVWDRDAA